MRILYLHRTRAGDGQSVHIDELIEAFRAQGHPVAIIGPPRIDAMKSGLERSMLPPAAYELAELAYSLVEFFRLLGAARHFRPDMIYQRANLYMLSGLWLSRLLRLPLFVEVNAPLAEERRKFGKLVWPRLARWSETKLWHGADMVLPVTRILAGRVADAGVPPGHIATIANGVDRARFPAGRRAAAKAALGLQGQLVLGFVGYVRAWHGLERVADLLAGDDRLAGAHLVVIGDGPALDGLKQRTAELGIASRVHLLGILPRARIAEAAAAFDIALQPEVTPYASPLKLFEYMALGHAVVAPDLPNIREVLTDGHDALLFSPGDSGAFGEAVARLAADETLRNRLGDMALDNLTRNDRTWRGNARRIIALAEEIAARRARPAPRLARAEP